MDKVLNCLFAAITLLVSVRGEVFKGKEGLPGRVLHVGEHTRSPVCVDGTSWETKWKKGKGTQIVCALFLSGSLVAHFEAWTIFFSFCCGVKSSRRGSHVNCTRVATWSQKINCFAATALASISLCLFSSSVAAVRNGQVRNGPPERLDPNAAICPDFKEFVVFVVSNFTLISWLSNVINLKGLTCRRVTAARTRRGDKPSETWCSYSAVYLM